MRIKAFADGFDIYCASASKMFNIPVEKTESMEVTEHEARLLNWPLAIMDPLEH